MDTSTIKEKAIKLRKQGNSYGKIIKVVGDVPKSTLTYWFKNINLSTDQNKKILELIKKGGNKGRAKALLTNKIRRQQYLQSVKKRVEHLKDSITNHDTAKIALAMLYLGEGSKKTKGSLIFGNSDPNVIKLFLGLFRSIYNLDEKKFRCTVQCRADQNTKRLERFWTKITRIPPRQFYKSRIDPRTIGKPTKNINYKGVCKIDYFSADLFYEIMAIIQHCQTH